MSGLFTIYDSASPSTLPDLSTPARIAAVQIESRIRNDGLETGAFIAHDGSIVIQKTGSPNCVRFSHLELVGTTGTLFTHNHPDDGTFSAPDVVAAIESRLVELRAVGPNLRHMLRAPGGWPPVRALFRAIATAAPVAQHRARAKMNAGSLDPRYAQREVEHQLWREVANRLSLRYEREKS